MCLLTLVCSTTSGGGASCGARRCCVARAAAAPALWSSLCHPWTARGRGLSACRRSVGRGRVPSMDGQGERTFSMQAVSGEGTCAIHGRLGDRTFSVQTVSGKTSCRGQTERRPKDYWLNGQFSETEWTDLVQHTKPSNIT